jgi:hypothetical protein
LASSSALKRLMMPPCSSRRTRRRHADGDRNTFSANARLADAAILLQGRQYLQIHRIQIHFASFAFLMH